MIEALRFGWITTGPKTKELERKVAERCCTSKAVCLNSNTACAEMTLRILGVGEGDEVIVPAYTYTATASVVAIADFTNFSFLENEKLTTMKNAQNRHFRKSQEFSSVHCRNMVSLEIDSSEVI